MKRNVQSRDDNKNDYHYAISVVRNMWPGVTIKILQVSG